MLWRPGSSWGFGALLKGTSVVVLRVERALVIHSPHLQSLPARDSNSQPFDYESDSLTIRPRLPPIYISEDLTWTTHIQTQVKKARQRLYHLRQLRKFRVSPTILKTFYAGTIESVLTQCISVWYGNSSSQDCKALQRVVRLAERISGSALPSLQDIYLKRCRSRAVKIIKDSNHPGNCLFTLLPSGKRFRSLMAKTEET